jgi:hypothetical protein
MALGESGVTFILAYSMIVRVVINKSFKIRRDTALFNWLKSGESAYVAPDVKYNIHGWPTRVTSDVGP